jgi:hypothetical protein
MLASARGIRGAEIVSAVVAVAGLLVTAARRLGQPGLRGQSPCPVVLIKPGDED